jgi:hypothetical protein
LREKARTAALWTVLVLTAPLWIPGLALLIALAVVARLVKVSALYALAWTFWLGASPRRILFVYSDSPNWKAYVEARILPRLPENSVVLNWSQRGQWQRFSLPVTLFHCFAGDREFNPIGLVFDRWHTVKDYRFWQPFRDAKHGHVGALEYVEAQFLRHAGSQAARK